MKFTSVTDSSQMEHAKKSQELQSEVSPGLPFLYPAAVSWAWEPPATTTSCPGTIQEPDRLGPAVCMLLGCLWELGASRPHPLHFSLVGAGTCPLRLLLFSFQYHLVPSSFFLSLSSVSQKLHNSGASRGLPWRRITFACGLCVFPAHLSSGGRRSSEAPHVSLTP